MSRLKALGFIPQPTHGYAPGLAKNVQAGSLHRGLTCDRAFKALKSIGTENWNLALPSKLKTKSQLPAGKVAPELVF